MDTFFLYLKVIMSTGFEQMFFEQHKKISQLKFYWNTQKDILYEAQTISESLRKSDQLSEDHIFNFNQVLFEFSQAEVDAILEFLFNPSNMFLIIGGDLEDWKTKPFESYDVDYLDIKNQTLTSR